MEKLAPSGPAHPKAASTSGKTKNPMIGLLYYSILMVTLPIVAFFLTQYVAEKYFDLSSSKSGIYATACSVIVIHIILAMFVYSAYKEDKIGPWTPEKED